MKKNSVKPKKTKEYHLLMYVFDSSPRIKKFTSTEKMKDFIDSFLKKYPDHMSVDSGTWIDYIVTGVTGDVHFYTDGLEVD